MNLLTTPGGNPKTAKGAELGYLTAVLHLAPASLSGMNVCQYATAGCKLSCLNTAGRGGIAKGKATFVCPDGTMVPDNRIQRCRIERTRLFFAHQEVFRSKLVKELTAFERKCTKAGLKAVVRLNGTSDLPWERIFPGIFETFKNVQFYDYTKNFNRMVEYVGGSLGAGRPWPANYHLTFSRSEDNGPECRAVLNVGGQVAVVFDHTKPLPATFEGRPVVNGDRHDLRFLDGREVVVGLKAKGRARKDDTGFTYRRQSPADWLREMTQKYGHCAI